jgi:hypothetical protein
MSLSKKPKRPDTPLAPTPVVRWENDIKNPANKPYVAEVAFNERKKLSKVTQEEFNKRYGIAKDSIAYKKK